MWPFRLEQRLFPSPIRRSRNSSSTCSEYREENGAENNRSTSTRNTVEGDEEEEEEETMTLNQYFRGLEKAFLDNFQQDRNDVDRCMERERKFSVAYNRMSRNQLWATKKGDPKVPYEATVEEYKGGQEIWPRGRHLDDLSVYGQIWDYFRFQWGHTQPYWTVGLIMLMSLARPFENALLAYLAQEIEQDPKAVPVWLYFTPFFVDGFGKYLYWWYEMWVPLNSQRVQLRSVLLSQRIRIPDGHPMATKWPPGRFNGLLKDVDDVVNQIWKSCLDIFDDLVTIIYLFILCFVNLYVNDSVNDLSFGAYIGLFLALTLTSMGFPFLWFHFFKDTVVECEDMVREGQALYLSVSSDAITMAAPKGGTIFNDTIDFFDVERGARNENSEIRAVEEYRGEDTSRQAYRVYGFTTFRAFFHRLAWTTNYDLITSLFGPLVAYGLLTVGPFGQSFNLTSTLILILSLKDIASLSHKLLRYLLTMVRGCSTLQDVAELLNTKIDSEDQEVESDLEDGDERRHRRQPTMLF